MIETMEGKFVDDVLRLADLAAHAVIYPREFHENTEGLQQSLSTQIAVVRFQLRKERKQRHESDRSKPS